MSNTNPSNRGRNLLNLAGGEISRNVVVFGLIAVVGLVLGAVIYIPADNQFEQRLGIVTMICALILPVLVGVIRGDKAANVSEDTKQDTTKLLNGEMRQAMIDVIHTELEAHDERAHGIKPGSSHAAPIPSAQPHGGFHPRRHTPPDPAAGG